MLEWIEDQSYVFLYARGHAAGVMPGTDNVLSRFFLPLSPSAVRGAIANTQSTGLYEIERR